MPPITRHQSRKCNLKPEPYSKENRPRTALSDLVSNNGIKNVNQSTKATVVTQIDNRVFKNGNTNNLNTNKVIQQKNEISKPAVVKKPETRSSTKEATHSTVNNTKDTSCLYQTADEELYTTAVDSTDNNESNQLELYESAVQELSVNCNEEEIFEIDQNSWNNFMYVGCYARDIFKYLKRREEQFIVTDYISDQSELTPRHRAIVVNWLVTLQEVFALNHEVLYMAVKLIDLYLMKNETLKDKFQLLASAAILLSSKIDERELGFPYDLVKQSKYIFTEDELFVTERELAKALNYDINIPMSYCFLRRFARCMKVQMILLTLARYILESSLLNYSLVTVKDSLKAAASLYLAFKMCSKPVDEKEFYKYTGYRVKEISTTVIAFNNMLHNQSSELTAVKQKYSHETFYRVACKSLISNSKLTFG